MSGADLNDSPAAVLLAPRFWVPLALLLPGLLLTAAAFLWHSPGPGLLPPLLPLLVPALLLTLFALFLLLQAALLRLRFDAEGLQVLRGGRAIRTFPWALWIGWRLFWPGLPVLFYFREERSIHLLPMLFDADGLRSQLERHVGPAATTTSR